MVGDYMCTNCLTGKSRSQVKWNRPVDRSFLAKYRCTRLPAGDKEPREKSKRERTN